MRSKDLVSLSKAQESENFNVIIIGGGASGMSAAISLKRLAPEYKVLILEKNKELGRKLEATGNGRCNLTNESAKAYGEIKEFFENLGLLLRSEGEGRVYPYNEQARAVVFKLTQALFFHSVKVELSASVAEVQALPGKGFKVSVIKEGQGSFTYFAEKVLIASGGKAGPQFGTIGEGYRWAKALGHRVTTTIPVLTPVISKESVKELVGTRVKASVGLYKSGKEVAREDGEVQFTSQGLSGIAVFNLTRFIRKDIDGFSSYEFSLDLMPEYREEEIVTFIKKQGLTLNSRDHHLVYHENPKAMESLILGLLPIKLSVDLVQKAIKICSTCGNVTNEDFAKSLASLIKGYSFTVDEIKGWQFAQCTAGGVVLEEVDSETMESKIVKNLYFAGEILDYDGPCGGFNLQHAWETGIKAGKAMALNV